MPNTGTVGVVKLTVATHPFFRPLLAAWFGTKCAKEHFQKAFWPYWSILHTGEITNYTYRIDGSKSALSRRNDLSGDRQGASRIEGYIYEAIGVRNFPGASSADDERPQSEGANQSAAMPFGRRLACTR